MVYCAYVKKNVFYKSKVIRKVIRSRKNWYNIIKNWLLLNEISEFKKVGSVVLW